MIKKSRKKVDFFEEILYYNKVKTEKWRYEDD